MLRRMLTKQWSFFWAGVGFGIAQIIYIVGNYVLQAQANKPLTSVPITVTTNLGGMFRAMEVFWLGGQPFGLPKGLYGAAFSVDTWGPIIGMIIGGLLVALLERESRAWVRYSGKMLFISFLGGILFSYGTRLADGCTLNHLLGGIPLMSIKATVVSAMMTIGGLTAFFIMAKLGVGPYFKHQETKSYVKTAKERGLHSDGITFDPAYNPWKDPIRWIGLIFLILFLIPALLNFFSPASKHSIPNSGLAFIGLTLLAGIVGGFAMAKSGFGTECALISAEASYMLKKDEKRFINFGIPNITRTLFKGLMPLQGLMASIVLTGVFVVGAWLLFGIKLGFQEPVKNQLTTASLVGGLLLGAGAVMLIGCEIRSYMRLGLLYTNTLVGFIGFAIGYLPFSLFYDWHSALLKGTVIVKEYTWGQLLFGNNLAAQQIFAIVWTLALIGILVWSIRTGARNLNARQAQVLNRSTEDLEAEVRGMRAAAAPAE